MYNVSDQELHGRDYSPDYGLLDQNPFINQDLFYLERQMTYR